MNASKARTRWNLFAWMIVASGLAAVGEVSEAADWPNWRGPNHDGTTAEKFDAKKIGNVAWKAELGRGYASFAVVGDRVYTAGWADGQDTIWCLDAGSGKVIWKFSYAAEQFANSHEGGPSATPTVHDGLVYTNSKDGQVHCLKADTGEVVWKANVRAEAAIRHTAFDWGECSSGAIVGANVVFEAGRTVAFDRKTGRVAWKSQAYKAGYSTPLPFRAGGRDALAVFNGTGLVVMNPANGATLTEYRWNTSYDVNTATPIAVAGGKALFISSGYGKGCALVPVDRNPKPVWQNQNMRNHFNSCVLVGQSIYGVDGNTGQDVSFKCLDATTGEVAWSQGGLGCGAVIVADGKLLIIAEHGELVVADASPTGFKPIARANVLGGTCWTAPVLANGRIYVRNATGQMVCIDVR
ncbi:MAG: PQQ-binding-like beta-propeller repeat protein [Phycisphaera sp.]|nr:PQQ-binding-like beta-propeller repeat protein [Phycisphaera sp.]